MNQLLSRFGRVIALLLAMGNGLAFASPDVPDLPGSSPFQLPQPDGVASAPAGPLAATSTPGTANQAAEAATDVCLSPQGQLGVCCAAAGLGGAFGASACASGEWGTALIAGGVVVILASGVVGGLLGWQLANGGSEEDQVLATQIGAGVGILASTFSVGGGLVALGAGANCMGCGSCSGKDRGGDSKAPAKKKRRRRTPRRSL